MSRKAFIEELTVLADKDPRVILIVGDVGFSFLEAFKERFPNQFLNAGIAEQAMMNVAVGLSHVGWKPYVYTMINFIIFRPYEQVRNDLCHQNANVKLFGIGGDVGYNFMGFGHNVEKGEEEQLLSHLPNLNRYYPTTDKETKDAMEKEYKRQGPSFMRL